MSHDLTSQLLLTSFHSAVLLDYLMLQSTKICAKDFDIDVRCKHINKNKNNSLEIFFLVGFLSYFHTELNVGGSLKDMWWTPHNDDGPWIVQTTKTDRIKTWPNWSCHQGNLTCHISARYNKWFRLHINYTQWLLSYIFYFSWTQMGNHKLHTNRHDFGH